MATSICALATAAQASETTTYAYDALGRLVAVNSSGTVNNGIATSLGYDPAGNRSAYTVTGAGGGASPPPPSPPPPPPPSGNQPPVTAGDSASIPRCGTVTHNVLANDTDPEGHYPLSLTAVTYGGALGSASIASGTSIFFEGGQTSGTAVVGYTVQDSLGATATGTFTVTITTTFACY